MSFKFITFLISLLLGLYFLFSGSFVIGLILVCLALLIPAA